MANQYVRTTILIISLFLSNLTVNAQKKTVVKLNLANVIIEDFPTIQIEKLLNKSSSVQFGLGFYSKKHQYLPVDVLNAVINGKPVKELLFDEVKKCLITLDFRQYLSKKRVQLTGFYFSPHLMMNYPLFEKLMVGVNLGYQKVLKNGLVINVGGGLTNELDRKNIEIQIGTQPRLQVGLGWAF